MSEPTRRVLHLIDHDSASWPVLHAIEVLRRADAADGRPHRHDAALIGGTTDQQRARFLGLGACDRIAAPRGSLRAATGTLRRVIAAHGAPDAVIAWSAQGAVIAAGACGSSKCIAVLALSPRMAMTTMARRRVSRALAAATVLHVSRDGQRRWAEALDVAASGRVAPLPIEPELLSGPARSHIRAEWGLDDRTSVVAGCGEPDSSVDARLMAYQVGVLTIAGRAAAAILPAGARDVERGLRFTLRHEKSWRLILEPRAPWAYLGGCDAAMWCTERTHASGMRSRRPATGTAGVAWAAAAGVPIVAEDCDASREALGDHGAHWATPGSALSINRSLLRALTDADANAPILDGARRHVMDQHAPSAWIAAMRGAIDS